MTTARVVAGALLSLLFAAEAHSSEGLYLSVEGGGGSVADWEHKRTKWTPCGPQITEARAAFDANMAAFAAVGYAFDPWRVEFEAGYRRNNIKSYSREDWRWRWDHDEESRSSGELAETSLMANFIYDVHLFERFSLAIGVGAGGDYTRFKLLDTEWAPVNEGDWHFAYQGLAGLNYALTAATTLFVNYRYSDVRNINFDPTPRLHLAGRDFEKQAVTGGVRFALFVPGPAVVPSARPTTPAAAPLVREFMVFFGFNQSSLSDEALATVRQVVAALHESGSAKIRVVGHADRAGSIAYNKALSLRRAKSVQKVLVTQGISAEAISIAGRGESEPLVPTADGVREPQNRRVHISF